MRTLVIALVLSIIFHLSQYELVSKVAGRLLSHNETTPLTIDLVEPTPPTPIQNKMNQQYVKTEVQNEVTEVKASAQFLAEKTQRVQMQTRAENYGQFRKKGGSNSSPQPAQKTLPDGDFFKQNHSGLTGESGRAQQEFDLPRNIKYGNATVLNTDADIFASFYNRVTDLVYVRWMQKLDALMNQLPLETKQKLSGRTWSSEVEIQLDSEGHYLRGLIMKKSGFQPFDAAAIFGFQNAGFFPNPPKGKVESDGLIRLKYRISVSVGYF